MTQPSAAAFVRPKRAIIYVRLSKYRGTDDPTTSPIRQREAGEAYAAAQGWDVVDVVEDLDESGGEAGLRLDRPGLSRIRDRFSEIDAVVFLKLDRLARSVADFSAFASEAGAHGVALVSVRDGLDLSTPGGRFVAQILAAFAEMELATITERTRDGKRKSRELGRWNGGIVPYGFRVVDGALELDEGEAAALHAAADAFLAGRSRRSIVRELQEALPARLGGIWQWRTLRQIFRGANAPALFGVERAVLLTDATDGWSPAAPRTARHLLSGIARCASCGEVMYAIPAGPANRGGFVYRCQSSTTGRPCSRPLSARAAALEAWVEEAYLDALGPIEETIAVPVADERLVRIAELSTVVERLQVDVGAMRGPERRAAFDRLEEAEEALERLRAERGSGLRVLRSTGRTLGEAWASGDVEERRALVRAWLGTSGLTIGPAKPGARAFDPARILDGARLTAGDDVEITRADIIR